MSYWVYLDIDTGGDEPATVCECGNYTCNCSNMFYDAMGVGLSDLHGRNCGEIAEMIIAAARKMQDNPERYRAMNPPNGWGDYESATEYLMKIGFACRKHPKAHLCVS